MKTIAISTDPGKKKKKKMKVVKEADKTTYQATSIETGDPRYGKPGKGTKVKKQLDAARAKKQDVVHINGLPYRAGHTTKTIGKLKPTGEMHKPKNPEVRKVSTKAIPSTPKAKAKAAASKKTGSGKRKSTQAPVVKWLSKKETKRKGMANPSKRGKGRKRTY